WKCPCEAYACSWAASALSRLAGVDLQVLAEEPPDGDVSAQLDGGCNQFDLRDVPELRICIDLVPEHKMPSAAGRNHLFELPLLIPVRSISQTHDDDEIGSVQPPTLQFQPRVALDRDLAVVDAEQHLLLAVRPDLHAVDGVVAVGFENHLDLHA